MMWCGAAISLAVACGNSAPAVETPAGRVTANSMVRGALVVTTVVPAVTVVARADSSAAEPAAGDLFPDVLDVKLEPESNGRWTVSATISSPYDSPERYADGFRVTAADGSVLGERVLAHDHASEQPFTRSLSSVLIPAETESIVVEARDQISGYGGATVSLPVPG